uniref:Putative regulatory protein n=1 Tax=viral metagenome TaxID=1070528 RepID=A0A6M3LJX2_9ZZZZ
MSAKLVKVEQEKLVHIKRGVPVTTSLIVARAFGKRHDSVTRSILNLKDLDEFNRLTFVEREYVDVRGKTQPMYEMNRDSFVMLVMSFTGQKAFQWKLNFMEAFNALEEEVIRQHNEDWKQARLDGKAVRRELTNEIKAFIEYAKAQGSIHADHYYENLSKAINKALFILEDDAPKAFRNLLSGAQLAFVATAEHVAHKGLVEAMAMGLHYKECYAFARDKVFAFAATVGQTPVRNPLALLPPAPSE